MKYLALQAKETGHFVGEVSKNGPLRLVRAWSKALWWPETERAAVEAAQAKCNAAAPCRIVERLTSPKVSYFGEKL